jgi:hypothetical protein
MDFANGVNSFGPAATYPSLNTPGSFPLGSRKGNLRPPGKPEIWRVTVPPAARPRAWPPILFIVCSKQKASFFESPALRPARAGWRGGARVPS